MVLKFSSIRPAFPLLYFSPRQKAVFEFFPPPLTSSPHLLLTTSQDRSQIHVIIIIRPHRESIQTQSLLQARDVEYLDSRQKLSNKNPEKENFKSRHTTSSLHTCSLSPHTQNDYKI